MKRLTLIFLIVIVFFPGITSADEPAPSGITADQTIFVNLFEVLGTPRLGYGNYLGISAHAYCWHAPETKLYYQYWLCEYDPGTGQVTHDFVLLKDWSTDTWCTIGLDADFFYGRIASNGVEPYDALIYKSGRYIISVVISPYPEVSENWHTVGTSVIVFGG